MWLYKIAWKNLWRNRSRTLITMSAIFFAVILSVLSSSLKDGIFNNLVKNVVSFYTGYVQVHKEGYYDEQILDNGFVSTAALTRQIRSAANVSDLSPRLESFALATSGKLTKGCMVIGIDPERERSIISLDQKIITGSYITATDDAVIMGEGLARRLKLTVNDTVVLIGQGYHGTTAAGKYLLKGIVHFGTPDLNDQTLFMPLLRCQEFYNAEGLLTSYVISLRQVSGLEETVSALQQEIGADYEVMSWDTMLPEIKQHIEADSNNMKYVQGLLYLLICFGIFGTLLMMMAERQYELGMLLAIGMQKSRLSWMLVIESIISVVAGCLGGILVSIPLVIYFNQHPIRMGGEAAKAYERFGFEAIFPTSTAPANFITQGLIVLCIALVLSLYPVVKIIRLNAVTAMKK